MANMGRNQWRWIRKRYDRYLRRHINSGIRQAEFIIAWPFVTLWKSLTSAYKRGSLLNLIFGLPAFIILVAVIWVSFAIRIDLNDWQAKYWQAANTAIAQREFDAAEIYLNRIIADKKHSRDAEFALGEVLEETGRDDRAKWLFQKLAPNDQRGFPPAHRKRAIQMIDEISSRSTTEQIREFRWHLSNSDEQQSPGIARAWAAYYLSLNQAKPAIKFLEQAVGEFPELSLLLGELQLRNNDRQAGLKSYQRATNFLRARIASDPENSAVRVTLGNTLLKLGEFEECQEVLRIGLRLDPEGPYKQLLASLFTNRHDLLASQGGASISDLLGELRFALAYDPNFTPAYERLVEYGSARVEGEASLETILNQVIATGEQPGLAHFSMSILKWKEGDVSEARWHLERAHKLLPEMPFVANNLAWTLATEEPQDLERALVLIKSAVDRFPTESRLLDTLATIQMELEHWEDAFDSLEKALANSPTSKSRVELHEKLAEVCDQLGRTGLANEHRKLAQSNASENPVPEEDVAPILTPSNSSDQP